MNANRSVINLLDANTINQIAAGEVIERPASIVKELVENAIDAGSTQIVVDFQEGGKKRIRVSDNGKGIYKEDFSKIFLRHTTSKISKAKDLYAITSLGFRGEALASIAAVASVQLFSKGEEEEEGHYIHFRGGKQLDFHPTGSNQGTQIVVEDLFFNTPVRSKFLKSTQVESARIYDIVKRTALSFPAISFECIREGQQIFYTSGNGKVEDILLDLQGVHYFEQLFPIDAENSGIKVSGFLSDPNASRGSRNHQYFFLNHRFVSSRIFRFALEEAFKPYLMKGRFPIAILSVEMDPSRIDVNVHPTKLEVRFQGEKEVQEQMTSLLKSALYARLQPKTWKFEENNNAPEKKQAVQLEKLEDSTEVLSQWIHRYALDEAESTQLNLSETEDPLNHSADSELSKERVPDRNYSSLQPSLPAKSIAPFAYPSLYISEIFGTYLLAKSTFPEALYLIDQHAAHERILYEKIRSQAWEQSQKNQQLLLQARAISLNQSEKELAERYKDRFARYGIEIESLGDATMVLRSVPLDLSQTDPERFFIRLLDEISRLSERILSSDEEDAIAQSACKAAVKAGDPLNKEEIYALFNDLQKCEDPFHCPHGRPTMIRLTQAELEKKFGRRT
jgi:DNA mismatch repair protein MutL